jgi:hypothetical protein
MKRLIVLLFALVALPALADDFAASNGRDSVRLTQGACSAEILKLLQPALHDKVKAAQATVGGTSYVACWALLTPGFVDLFYADGDMGLVPLADFKRVPGV